MNVFTFINKLKQGTLFVASIAMIILSAAPVGVTAASSDSLYTYSMYSASGSVSNSANANSSVDLNLIGDWTSSTEGTEFSGNLTSTQSVGYANPSGDTINVDGSEAVGAAVIISYQGPAPGTCYDDSQNISQIGFFGNNTAQIKLQLSKCRSGQVYPECRIAGLNTPSGNYALRGNERLQDGNDYRIECVKAPDSGSSTTVEMRVTSLTESGNTSVKSFNIPATGSIRSSSSLSVGNKYPLPSQSKNSDQFNGTVKTISYCRGDTLNAAQNCLDEEVSVEPSPATACNDGIDNDGDGLVDLADLGCDDSNDNDEYNAPPPTIGVDEVKYAYAENPGEVVFSWRGNEQTIYYGLTSDYGNQAVAGDSAITPVDIEGPFREVKLSGLSSGTTYHYKIGEAGDDYTFKTAAGPTDSFKAIAVGDTIAESCRSYQDAMNAVFESEAADADLMLHGGDISIANECGEQAVHEYYTDIESITRETAFMPAWGNHEYGQPTHDAPAGTPRDTLANYKGRSYIPNAQTIPNDTPTKTSHPGCGAEIGSSVNTCMGEDWGWYVTGRVMFITYPENAWNSFSDFRDKADVIMSQAQNDEDIDFIVTYGHMPLLSSTDWDTGPEREAAFGYLGDTYGAGSVAGGKYILNIAGHRHNLEVLDGFHGVKQVVNGGGGQGLISFQSLLQESEFQAKKLGFVTLDYNADSRELTQQLICGVAIYNDAYTCDPGEVIYSQVFTSSVVPPVEQPATLQTQITNNQTEQEVGQQTSYDVNVQNVGDMDASDVEAVVTIPANTSIVNSGSGVVSGQTVTYNLSSVAGNSSLNNTLTLQLDSGSDGEQIAIEVLVSATNNACNETDSDCTDSDIDTVVSQPTLIEVVTNPSIESDLNGWLGKYGGTSVVAITRSQEQAHTGTSSIKVEGLSGASNRKSGFSDSPDLVSSTEAGRTYSGSIWVKPQEAGQQIVFRLREWTSGWSLVTDEKLTYTATGTDWVNITNEITAQQNGNHLAFIVYGQDVDSGDYFYVDDLSFTTTP
jgi:uncharacterized repeat protein (TIGR01451 family)